MRRRMMRGHRWNTKKKRQKKRRWCLLIDQTQRYLRLKEVKIFRVFYVDILFLQFKLLTHFETDDEDDLTAEEMAAIRDKVKKQMSGWFFF